MRPFLTLHHPAAAARYYEQGAWQGDTFYTLMARHAETSPDAWALRDGSRQLSWGEVKRSVDAFAAELRAQGLSGGDRVSIWMSNRVEAIITFLACSREGFACNPSLHRTLTCAEVASLLDRLRAKALIVEPGHGADRKRVDLDAALKNVSSLRAVYTPADFPEGAAEDAPHIADPDKVTYLAFTSGTTGAPKCVMHSDNTLLANARNLVAEWGHDASTRILTLSPLSHHIAWVAVGQWLVAGCELITGDPPKGASQLDWIVATGATYVLGVPTHAMDILAEQTARGLCRLGAVRTFYLAGSPIPPSVAEAFVAQGIRPQNVYGMTENSSHQFTHPDDDTDVIVSTCGRGGRAYEMRLFDPLDSDKEVPRGEIGHIGGRGPALMLGYLDNQTATEDSFNRDGWFLSGDLGVLDGEGNLKIVGRLKDLIIRGGHNIYPAHIEALVLRHSGVTKAAAFPIADERLGERVCIAIVGTAQANDLLEHLDREGLSQYDMPEYFLRLSEFPLTASGKILKRELVEQVAQGRLGPEPIKFRSAREVA